MKTIIAALLCLGFLPQTHAQLLVPKGTHGVLKVEYAFSSDGSYASPSKDQNAKWSVKRAISLTASYAAEAPQPFGMLHSQDVKQQADMKTLEAQAMQAYGQQAPMMGDMMAIARQCNADREDLTVAQMQAAEACVTAKVQAYANHMALPTNLAAGQSGISKMAQAGGPRFQLWQLKSQVGSYSVEEFHQKQIFEMTCTAIKICRREEVRKGGGEVPAPANGMSIAGSSVMEVDSMNKDMMLALPMPLAPLKVTQSVTTSIPGEKGGVTDTFAQPWTLPLAKPITVKIPSDLRTVNGAQEIKVTGERGAGGTLRVRWTFTRL